MARKSVIKRRRTLLQKAQAEIKRLSAFQAWIRMNGDHTWWCPAKNKEVGKSCTCGFSHLYSTIK